MENLDYVKLALSKDNSRFNLCKVYRDKNHFVATDGHRLHIANGLPDAIPGYLDGADYVFPEYNQVLPNTDAIGSALSISMTRTSKDVLVKTKAFLKMVALVDRIHNTVRLCCKNGKPLQLVFKEQKTLLIMDLDGFEYIGKNISLGINLKYLIDAISFAVDHDCRINIFSAEKCIEVKSERCGEHTGLTAIIMPLRLPK